MCRAVVKVACTRVDEHSRRTMRDISRGRRVIIMSPDTGTFVNMTEDM